MIEIFGSQAPSGANPAAARARDLGRALQHRLRHAVAIPALIFYRHFRAKVDSFVLDMEQQAARLVDIVHGDRG